MGRRKIEMVKVQDRSALQVTFSKRRNGLFKKANELATLCDVDIAIIVFSPGGKVYSYGKPNVTSIIDRFLHEQEHGVSSTKKRRSTSRRKTKELEKLSEQVNNGDMELEKEKKKRKKRKYDENEEMKRLKEELEILKEEVDDRKHVVEASSTLMMISNDTF
ncbi:hypothetical protein CsatB_001967 [Cannabis sativa]|uniref:MADS-box domain-containing protein n=2 Tax=Cannabis sativa TaxID=3483 RepID=A0A7J6EP67_CANSA|nr:agamous-like MADS-box protein AGL29 [Cannabis sativa]KAF4360145.1 hypothetical protein F8388_000014 [Cannabis sativa]KAF4386025.1 hypothetical protein G4B88_031160 [Cannabis sativa]